VQPTRKDKGIERMIMNKKASRPGRSRSCHDRGSPRWVLDVGTSWDNQDEEHWPPDSGYHGLAVVNQPSPWQAPLWSRIKPGFFIQFTKLLVSKLVIFLYVFEAFAVSFHAKKESWQSEFVKVLKSGLTLCLSRFACRRHGWEDWTGSLP